MKVKDCPQQHVHGHTEFCSFKFKGHELRRPTLDPRSDVSACNIFTFWLMNQELHTDSLFWPNNLVLKSTKVEMRGLVQGGYFQLQQLYLVNLFQPKHFAAALSFFSFLYSFL